MQGIGGVKGTARSKAEPESETPKLATGKVETDASSEIPKCCCSK